MPTLQDALVRSTSDTNKINQAHDLLCEAACLMADYKKNRERIHQCIAVANAGRVGLGLPKLDISLP